MQSLLKSQVLFCWNWQENPKIHTEIQETRNNQNNLEKEQNWKTYSYQLKIYYTRLCGKGISGIT